MNKSRFVQLRAEILGLSNIACPQDIVLVLQLRPPRDPLMYVHRAGRTGRAGHGGTVLCVRSQQFVLIVALFCELIVKQM